MSWHIPGWPYFNPQLKCYPLSKVSFWTLPSLQPEQFVLFSQYPKYSCVFLWTQIIPCCIMHTGVLFLPKPSLYITEHLQFSHIQQLLKEQWFLHPNAVDISIIKKNNRLTSLVIATLSNARSVGPKNIFLWFRNIL